VYNGQLFSPRFPFFFSFWQLLAGAGSTGKEESFILSPCLNVIVIPRFRFCHSPICVMKDFLFCLVSLSLFLISLVVSLSFSNFFLTTENQLDDFYLSLKIHLLLSLLSFKVLFARGTSKLDSGFGIRQTFNLTTTQPSCVMSWACLL